MFDSMGFFVAKMDDDPVDAGREERTGRRGSRRSALRDRGLQDAREPVLSRAVYRGVGGTVRSGQRLVVRVPASVGKPG